MTYRPIDYQQFDPQTIFGMTDIGDNCWTWMGSYYNNGYGKYGDRGVVAHRIAYELTKGDVPINMCLDHLCKNRGCINPDHLEIVTLIENVLRGDSQHAINARKTHCKRGHEFTPENTGPASYNGKPGRCCRKCNANREAERRKRIKQLI